MRLIDAAMQLDVEREKPKLVKVSSDLGISKDIAARWLSSDEFYSVKVDVDKLPLLSGELIASADAPRHIVVVDLNRNKINRSATYTPKITVVCGTDMVREAKKKKETEISCWISAKAAKVLKVKLPKLEATIGYNPHPNGPALGSFALPTTMQLKTLPDAINFGSPGSELNNPQFVSMLNIEEALSMYLSNLKNGIWKPISSQWSLVPPSLVNATNEAGLLAKDKKLAAGVFVPLDFVLWQQSVLEASVKHKHVDGVKLSASKFAFVGDIDDPSTWLFRADSKLSINTAMTELQACTLISKRAKKATAIELQRRNLSCS